MPRPSAPARALQGLVLLALLLSGCTAADPDTSGMPASCSPDIVVRDTDALVRAVARARPGDRIALTPGRYRTRLAITTPGTEERPIEICGPATAVVDAGEVDQGYAVHLDGASWWTVEGFTVTGGKKGVVLDATHHAIVRDLTIHDVGDEGLHLRSGSSDNLVEGVEISATGLRDPEFGEGIYVGSAESNWCEISACAPDRSDRNRIIGVTVSGTTAEAVDIKEGTRDGMISRSELTGTSAPESTADSVVDLKGNGWTITDNHLTVPPGQTGIAILHLVPGGGRNNTVRPNTFTLSPDADEVRR